MSTPALQLDTMFMRDAAGRLTATREPVGDPPPAFILIRGPDSGTWAIRAGVPAELADELAALARDEPPVADPKTPPRHTARYSSLLGGRIFFGPAFRFPESLPSPAGVAPIDDEAPLTHHFRGWIPGEIAAGRAPVMAVVADGHPVSVCFCARSSPLAAEAGLETAAPYRGRGLAARVTAAWAAAIRASGRVPLYSTSWENSASLAVTRKLALVPFACDWSISG